MKLVRAISLAIFAAIGASAALADDPKPKKDPIPPVPLTQTFFKGALKVGFTPSKVMASQLSRLTVNASRVDVACFDIDEPSFVEALVELHDKHKDVRVVMDSQNRHEANEPLARAGILKEDGKTHRPFMHTKLAVIDRRWVMCGSANPTENAFNKEDNNALLIDSPVLAGTVEKFVDQLWAGKFGKDRGKSPVAPAFTVGDCTMQMYFSPDNDPLVRVVKEIDDARKSIKFMCFNLSHKETLDALLRAHANPRKVQIAGVIDGSEWMNGGVAKKLEADGCSILMDGNPSLMHDKVFIIDDETVITGSFNFSAKAVEENDEDMLVIKSKDVAKAYLKAFDRIYGMGKKLPVVTPKPLAAPTPGITGALENGEDR